MPRRIGESAMKAVLHRAMCVVVIFLSIQKRNRRRKALNETRRRRNMNRALSTFVGLQVTMRSTVSPQSVSGCGTNNSPAPVTSASDTPGLSLM